MRNNRHIITLVALAVMVGAIIVSPLPGALLSQAYARETLKESQVIADTLAAHQIVCLSKDGLIETVFLDGKWVTVQEVELVNRTLILRTALGNLSLAAALNAP